MKELFRRKYVYVIENFSLRTKKKYYTIVNESNGRHCHCDNFKGAILICKGVAFLNLKENDTSFIKEGIKRII